MTAWTLERPDAAATNAEPIPDVEGAAITAADRRAWDDVVDRWLIPWGNGQVDIDDDLLPPTARSIRVAAALCHRFRDAGERPPTVVLPDGDGGVLLERRAGRASTQVTVLKDGDVERAEYDEAGFVHAALYPATQFVV